MISNQLMEKIIYQYGHVRSRVPFLLRRPLGYFLYITGRCNLRCNYCWQRDDEHRKEGWTNSVPDEMTPEEWRKVVEKIPRYSFLGLSGGEATISKAFPVILEAASARRLPVSLNTNGAALTDDAVAMIMRSSVRNVSISLDGFRDVHDKNRAMDGLYDKVIGGIERLNRLRIGSNGPSLSIKTVILNDNIDQLISFRDFCTNVLKADALIVSFIRTGDQAQVSLKYCDDFEEIMSDQTAGLYTYNNPENLIGVLESLIKGNGRAGQCEVVLYPHMKTREEMDYFLRNGGKGVYAPCYNPWSMVVVLPNGEVIPCLSWSMGNLRSYNYSVPELLRGGKYREFTACLSA